MNEKSETSVLSISSKYIHDCNNIALLLQKNGVFGNITPNQTIEKDMNKYVVTRGCKIMFTDTKPEDVVKTIWPELKLKFFLRCGHYQVGNKFSGCINNYLTKSKDSSS